MSTPSAPNTAPSNEHGRLAAAVTRTAAAVERQNSFLNRFLGGIAIGAGTAIGASLVASVVLVFLAGALRTAGLDNLLPKNVLPVTEVVE